MPSNLPPKYKNFFILHHGQVSARNLCLLCFQQWGSLPYGKTKCNAQCPKLLCVFFMSLYWIGKYPLASQFSTASQQQTQEMLGIQKCNCMIKTIRKIMVTDFYKNHSFNKDSVTITERKQVTLVTSLCIQMRKK